MIFAILFCLNKKKYTLKCTMSIVGIVRQAIGHHVQRVLEHCFKQRKKRTFLTKQIESDNLK